MGKREGGGIEDLHERPAIADVCKEELVPIEGDRTRPARLGAVAVPVRPPIAGLRILHDGGEGAQLLERLRIEHMHEGGVAVLVLVWHPGSVEDPPPSDRNVVPFLAVAAVEEAAASQQPEVGQAVPKDDAYRRVDYKE